MAYCDVCGNYDDSHLLECGVEEKSYEERPDYQPDLYYYWDAPLEEIYYWRDSFPDVDCMCEICFDIANEEKKIIWADHQDMEDNIEIIEDGDYKVIIDYENMTTTFELCDSENSVTTVIPFCSKMG